jgi:anti-repressor protein
MNELIKITERDGQKAVSARELHRFLEATERFQNWFDRQVQYGFVEGVDYVGCKEFNALANQELNDYALTIDCAKEISMLQRSEQGKLARQYFIECEKKLNALLPDFNNPAEAARAWAREYEQKQVERQKRLDAERKQEELQAENEAMKPKVLFADAVATSNRSILVSELAKILKQNGIEIGQNRLFQWLRDRGYLCTKGEYRNQPSQRAMELGLFEIKKTTINKPDGSILVSRTTKVTGKGQVYFTDKLLSPCLTGE